MVVHLEVRKVSIWILFYTFSRLFIRSSFYVHLKRYYMYLSCINFPHLAYIVLQYVLRHESACNHSCQKTKNTQIFLLKVFDLLNKSCSSNPELMSISFCYAPLDMNWQSMEGRMHQEICIINYFLIYNSLPVSKDINSQLLCFSDIILFKYLIVAKQMNPLPHRQ